PSRPWYCLPALSVNSLSTRNLSAAIFDSISPPPLIISAATGPINGIPATIAAIVVLMPTSITSFNPLGDCPPTRKRESEDLVIVIGGASSTSKTAQGSRPSADGSVSPIPTTDVNLSSIEIMRRSCDQPCDRSPEAPETVDRGRNEIIPVGRSSVA